MDGRRDSADDPRATRQPELPRYGSRQGPGYSKGAQSPPPPYRNGAAPPPASRMDESDLNPPWDRESGQHPVAPKLTQADNGHWTGVIEETYPGLSMDDMTGTGKILAMAPMRSSDRAWSGGVRAPKRLGDTVTATPGMLAAGVAVPGARDVEVDDQPSVQMRAMRAGNLARATAIVSAALLLSRVLGLFRQTLFASTFGLSTQADAFTNAFVLPDTIFNIVAGGALASAFIPVFTSYLIEKRDRRNAWHIASSALNLSVAILTLVAIAAFIFAPQILDLSLHPYFARGNSEGPLIVSLTRVMLLQPIFLGAATVAVAVLQSRQSFVLPAIGQVVYNLCLIVGIFATIADSKWGVLGGALTGPERAIYGPAWGVVAGAAVQFFIQVPGLVRAKMEYRPSFDVFHPGMRQMVRLMVPRLINAAMLYVSVFINRSLLGLLPNTVETKGSIYGYVTAFTLVMLPIGVFGMAVSQASFPSMAAFVAAGEWQRLRTTIMSTARGVTFLAIPSSLGIIVLADPLSRLILAHGNFDASRLDLITEPLIFFAIGLLGLSLVEILVRSFYALHDTRTAVEVSILQFMFVIGLSIILLDPMGAGGLALATALGSTGEAVVLLLLLRTRVGGLELRAFGGFFINVLAASVVAALAALLTYMLGDYILHFSTTETAPLFSRATLYLAVRLTAAILVACGAYYGVTKFLGISDTVPIDRIARRLFRRR